MAFGADRNHLVGLVMRGALNQVGLTLGTLVALIGARSMTDQLYLVKAYDPLSLVVAVLTLTAAAALAGYVPARRAASSDYTTAQRLARRSG